MGTQPGHEDLRISIQYLKLKKEIHSRECVGMRRDFRKLNTSEMVRIWGVNEKKKKTDQRGIKNKEQISQRPGKKYSTESSRKFK